MQRRRALDAEVVVARTGGEGCSVMAMCRRQRRFVCLCVGGHHRTEFPIFKLAMSSKPESAPLLPRASTLPEPHGILQVCAGRARGLVDSPERTGCGASQQPCARARAVAHAHAPAQAGYLEKLPSSGAWAGARVAPQRRWWRLHDRMLVCCGAGVDAGAQQLLLAPGSPDPARTPPPPASPPRPAAAEAGGLRFAVTGVDAAAGRREFIVHATLLSEADAAAAGGAAARVSLELAAADPPSAAAWVASLRAATAAAAAAGAADVDVAGGDEAAAIARLDASAARWAPPAPAAPGVASPPSLVSSAARAVASEDILRARSISGPDDGGWPASTPPAAALRGPGTSSPSSRGGGGGGVAQPESVRSGASPSGDSEAEGGRGSAPPGGVDEFAAAYDAAAPAAAIAAAAAGAQQQGDAAARGSVRAWAASALGAFMGTGKGAPTKRLLWVHGPPGAGKTSLVASVLAGASARGEAVVAAHFVRRWDAASRDPTAAVASLAFQLRRTVPGCATPRRTAPHRLRAMPRHTSHCALGSGALVD